MSEPVATESRLARADARPLLVTLLVVGWLILCGFGGVRALVVLGDAVSRTQFDVRDPMERLAAQDPELVGESTVRHYAMRDDLRSLELWLAGPLLVVSVLGGFGAVRLLRRRRGSRAFLVFVGVTAIAISGYHAYRSVLITTVDAAGIPEAEEMLPAFYAVAGINLALQSLPLVLVMSLLRHPIVGRYVREAQAPRVADGDAVAQG